MVWSPVFDVFKYRGKKQIKNSNLFDEKTKLLRKINEFSYPGSKWKKTLKRKIKNIRIYRLYLTKGVIYKLNKVVNLHNFKKNFGINETNRVVGFTPDYIGPSVSTIVNKHNYVLEFIKSNIKEIKNSVSNCCYEDLLSSIRQSRVVYSAGFDTCCEHLKEYLKDNTTSDIWTVKNIFKILEKSDFDWFRSSKCSFNHVEELSASVKMNPNAFAGHYTAMLFGRKKKYSSYASTKVASNIFESLRKTTFKNFYLWTILGREKDIKIDRLTSKEVGTRVVMTTEHPITLLLCWFAQKISYIVCSLKNWDCKFNINSEFDSAKYKRLVDKERDYDFILEADWRYYDSNIDTNFLICAGLLICFGLPEDKLHRNIRYLIISSIVTKYVAIPPGIVVEVNRAQPSGHPFGTLVNCYVNLIYWSIIGYKIYGDNYSEMMDIEVYGDDTRAFFKYHKNLINIDTYVLECGLSSEPLLPNFRAVNEDSRDSDQIDFLKRRFNNKGIKWNHKKMFDKFFYPSKNRDINDQYLMVSSWFDSVPTDSDSEILRVMFGKYLLSKYDHEINYCTRNLINSNIRSLGYNSRAEDKFTFDSYNYGFNSDYEDNIKVYRDTLIYRNSNCVLPKFDFGIYNDNSSIIALMLVNPELGYSFNDYSNIAFGRDPPGVMTNSNVFDSISKLVKVYNGVLESMVNQVIRRTSN